MNSQKKIKTIVPSFSLRRVGDLAIPKILVTSDDPLVLKLLQDLLKPMNVRIVCVSSGEEALLCLSRERFDLMISEWATADMSGADLLMAVQRDGHDIPVIVVNAHTGTEGMEECVKIGAFDYIAKPFDSDFLRAVVRRAILKKRWAGEPVFASDKMRELYSKVLKVAGSNVNVCIEGETGTGKELIARAIHHYSPRRGRPLVTLNCATISERFMQSLMGGQVKKAISSTVTGQKSVFQFTHGGTLFLDQISEIGLPLQARLLGIIESREWWGKIGSAKPIKVDIRIISATNEDLSKAIEKGKFREDLFYRINVISITIPPLRERREDIPVLVNFFLETFAWENNKDIKGVNACAMDWLLNYDWPGNVRELKNCIERAVVVAEGDVIDMEDIVSTPKESNNALKGFSSVFSSKGNLRLVSESGRVNNAS